MSKLSLSRAWDEARAVLTRDGRLFASVALAIVVLPQTLIGLVAPATPTERPLLTFALLLATMVIGFVAQISLNRLAIGPSTTVGGAIMRGLMRMPILLLAFLLLMLVLFLAMIPFVILLGGAGMASSGNESGASAGVVFMILLFTALAYAVFQLAVPVAASEEGGPIRLLKRSWQLARGNYLRLLLFVAMMFIGLMVVLLAGQVAFGSIVALSVGPPDRLSLSALLISLVTAMIQALFTVVFAVMTARIYVQLNGQSAEASVPNSGT